MGAILDREDLDDEIWFSFWVQWDVTGKGFMRMTWNIFVLSRSFQLGWGMGVVGFNRSQEMLVQKY